MSLNPHDSLMQEPPAPSLEQRFELLVRRIRTAHRAGLGLTLSVTEVQLLGMTSIVDWQAPEDGQDS